MIPSVNATFMRNNRELTLKISSKPFDEVAFFFTFAMYTYVGVLCKVTQMFRGVSLLIVE